MSSAENGTCALRLRPGAVGEGAKAPGGKWVCRRAPAAPARPPTRCPLPSPSPDEPRKPRLTSLPLHQLRIHQHHAIYTERESGEHGGDESAQGTFRYTIHIITCYLHKYITYIHVQFFKCTCNPCPFSENWKGKLSKEKTKSPRFPPPRDTHCQGITAGFFSRCIYTYMNVFTKK